MEFSPMIYATMKYMNTFQTEQTRITNLGREEFGYHTFRDESTGKEYVVRGNGTKGEPLEVMGEGLLVADSIRFVARLAKQRNQTQFGELHGAIYQLMPSDEGIDFQVVSMGKGSESEKNLEKIIREALLFQERKNSPSLQTRFRTLFSMRSKR
jgi:hypothetical protein